MRRTAPSRPTVPEPETSATQRFGLVLLIGALVAAVAMVVPSLVVAPETPTGRALSPAKGPLPRKAAAAHLPAAVGDLKRDQQADVKRLPWGEIDRAQFVDATGRRRLMLMTSTVQVTNLDEFEQRMGMKAQRFGRVSCGQRYDALQCTMLLDGGLLSATTIDPAWKAEELAGVVRLAYAGLPQ